LTIPGVDILFEWCLVEDAEKRRLRTPRVFSVKQRANAPGACRLSALFLPEPGVKRTGEKKYGEKGGALDSRLGKKQQRAALPSGGRKPASPGRVCRRSSASTNKMFDWLSAKRRPL